MLPHVKATTDFEVYERVTLPDLYNVLPWDENVKQSHTFKLKVCCAFMREKQCVVRMVSAF